MTIQAIRKHNLCIGCGFCAAVCPQECISLKWDSSKTWLPVIDKSKCTDCSQCLKVCPNAPDNLERIAQKTKPSPEDFGVCDKPENTFYISYAKDDRERIKSASGGTTSALLKDLLISGSVDCVIAAKACLSEIGQAHFEAVICRTPDQVDECRSSAYGPIRYDKVLKEILKAGETCAMTVLPCTQRGIDNFPPGIRKSIRYTIGIMCGLNVTDQFGDFMAFKHGIRRGRKFSINYRDKHNIPNAGEYNTCFHQEGKADIRTPRMTNGFTSLWRNYCFVQECCFYCPDFYAANADISVKDAWGRLSADPKGITLCISRNQEIDKHLKRMASAEQLYLEECNADEIKKSQNASAVFKQENFIHRWRRHPLLKNSVDKLDIARSPDHAVIKDYAKKFTTMRFMKFIFRGSAFAGYFLLRALVRIKAFGAQLIEFCKRICRKIVNKFRTHLGRIARIAGFLTPVKPNENRVAKDVSPKILITGGYGYGNVGDEAQLGTNITRWRKLLPDCELRIFSPNPEYTAHHHNVASILAPRVVWFNSNRCVDYAKSNKRFMKRFLRVKRRMILTARMLRAGLNIMFCSPAEARLLSQIQEADILHISGGGFLTGMTRSRLWENCLLMRLCYLLGTPVVLTGQTIGVFKSRRDHSLARWGLENAEYIYLRDNGESENDVRDLGISGEHIKSTCDDALFCEKSDEKTIKTILKEHGIGPSHRFIAVNFHFWGQSEEMKSKAVERFAEICDYLSNEGNIRLLFIPMVVSDEIPEKAVIEAMTSKAELLKYDYDYRIARGLIAEAGFCFTMKHHPIIFAYGEETPVISVALDDYYYRKNKGAMAHCGQEKYCLDEKTFFSPEAFERIDELIKNLDMEKPKISSWKNSIDMLDPLDKIKL